ncbi:MAG TPA: glycosyltransferase family 9 protein [Planctomycetota bacterium]|nr:glycosyltransferase family 9 protein [Planctomycetota bacterium]
MSAHVLLSRTDALGDVTLALPMAGAIKRHLPGARVSFLGRTYTQPVIEACEHVDAFVDWTSVADADEETQAALLRELGASHVIHVNAYRAECRAAHRAGIPVRIAMARRMWGLIHSNRWLFFGRRRSPLHETQLNLMMLRALGIHDVPDLDGVAGLYGLTRAQPLARELEARFDPGRIHVVLHPRSGGTAPEWGVPNFARLMRELDPERYQVFVTGSAREREQSAAHLPLDLPHVCDLMGRLDLHQLIALLGRADAAVASSTGPIHVAAALGTVAVGLYTARPSKNAARWGPVGLHRHWLVYDAQCATCLRGESCECCSRIPVERVLDVLADHGLDARERRLRGESVGAAVGAPR